MASPGRLPAQAFPKASGIDTNQQQVRLSHEMQPQGPLYLIMCRQMNKAISLVDWRTMELPPHDGKLPQISRNDLVNPHDKAPLP